LFVLGEGVAIEKIDRALVEAGFPIGPIALLDEVGVDVAGKVVKTMHGALGSRFKPPASTEKLIDDGRLGRKAARGFYQYSEEFAKGRRPVDPFVYGVLGVTPNKQLGAEQIVERCLCAMLNEAVRCLDDGIVRCSRDGDVGAIFGLGFPPYLGGPLAYVDQHGVADFLQRLQKLEGEHGERFRPAEALSRLVQSGQKLSELRVQGS
jgi:3-hydroxyacyl-CoA dehydrogenase/enoyl-CoA hydratase/3-hydroxybutyryl-CoA epimerase